MNVVYSEQIELGYISGLGWPEHECVYVREIVYLHHPIVHHSLLHFVGFDISYFSHHLSLDRLRCDLWLGYEAYSEKDLGQQSRYINNR